MIGKPFHRYNHFTNFTRSDEAVDVLMTAQKLPSALQAWLSEEHRTIGLAFMRFTLGMVTLIFYAQHLLQFGFLWGENGVVPFRTALSLRQLGVHSVFLISAKWNPYIYVIGLAVTFCFTVGYRTRLTSILFYIFTYSLYMRNPLLLDGGDNLLFLLAFYMMFTDSGRHFSFDSARRTSAPGPFRALLHNFGVCAIIGQMVVLYFTSAFYKIEGPRWQNGTAIYYILRSPEFNLSPLAHLIYQNDVVITGLTWSVIIFQLAWCFWIWDKRLRWLVVLGALLMHVMIAWFMGLVWFSTVMISAEFVVLSNGDYRQARIILRRLASLMKFGVAGHRMRALLQRTS